MKSFEKRVYNSNKAEMTKLTLNQGMLLIRMICGVNVSSSGPIKRIGALSQPILFIHSREDQYSLPDKALELYRLCSSEKKQISWFPHGAHSMVRITDPTGYDQAVNAYLRTL